MPCWQCSAFPNISFWSVCLKPYNVMLNTYTATSDQIFQAMAINHWQKKSLFVFQQSQENQPWQLFSHWLLATEAERNFSRDNLAMLAQVPMTANRWQMPTKFRPKTFDVPPPAADCHCTRWLTGNWLPISVQFRWQSPTMLFDFFGHRYVYLGFYLWVRICAVMF